MYESKLSFLKDLLTPSGLSLTITSALATFLILAGSSQVLGSAVPIYRLLLGDNASSALVEITRQDFIDAFTLFDNPLLNNILLFAFWMLVGITVWILVQNGTSLFNEIGDDFQKVHYEHHEIRHYKKAFAPTAQKVVFHFTMIIIIGLYLYLLWSVVYRWLVNVFISGLGVRLTPPGIFVMLVAIASMALALHILTIFFRLLFTRARLLG